MLSAQRLSERVNHDLQDTLALAQGARFDESLDLPSSLLKPGRIFARLFVARSLLAQDVFVIGGDLFA